MIRTGALLALALLMSSSAYTAGKGLGSLDDVSILLPTGASRVFLDPNLGTAVVPVLATTDAPDDTDIVEFFVARQGEALPGQRIGNDTLAPYLVDLTLGSGFAFNQVLTLVVRATSLSDDTNQVAVATQIGLLPTEGDVDYNGLPDSPAAVLSMPGDLWYSTAQLDDELVPEMTSSVALMAPLVSPPGTPWDVFDETELPASLQKKLNDMRERPAGQWILERYRTDR